MKVRHRVVATDNAESSLDWIWFLRHKIQALEIKTTVEEPTCPSTGLDMGWRISPRSSDGGLPLREDLKL